MQILVFLVYSGTAIPGVPSGALRFQGATPGPPEQILDIEALEFLKYFACVECNSYSQRAKSRTLRLL